VQLVLNTAIGIIGTSCLVDQRFLDGALQHLQDADWCRVTLSGGPLELLKLVQTNARQLGSPSFDDRRVAAVMGGLLRTCGESCSFAHVVAPGVSMVCMVIMEI
jgi:hypothetical protein